MDVTQFFLAKDMCNSMRWGTCARVLSLFLCFICRCMYLLFFLMQTAPCGEVLVCSARFILHLLLVEFSVLFLMYALSVCGDLFV